MIRAVQNWILYTNKYTRGALPPSPLEEEWRGYKDLLIPFQAPSSSLMEDRDMASPTFSYRDFNSKQFLFLLLEKLKLMVSAAFSFQT